MPSLDQEAPGRLPLELLYRVISYISDQKQLIYLCKSSYILCQIAQPALYRTVNTHLVAKASKAEPGVMVTTLMQHIKLFQTIRDPSFAHIVTEFRICISFCTRRTRGYTRKCSCNDFDRLLGETLLSLQGLQTLYFDCHCCETQHRIRHRYLESLRTTGLQELSFYCACSEDMIKGFRRVLNAPCMSNVTSLSQISYGSVHGELGEEDCLPPIKRLRFWYIGPMIRSLFAMETITHLVVAGWNIEETLHNLIQKRPRLLEHLSISNQSRQIPNFISLDPSLYSNLRHFGKIALETKEFSLKCFQDLISSLVVLPNLSSLQFDIDQGYEPLDGFNMHMENEELLHQMAKSAPLLRRMYVKVKRERHFRSTISIFWIWELRRGRWEVTKVLEFDAWSIAHEDA